MQRLIEEKNIVVKRLKQVKEEKKITTRHLENLTAVHSKLQQDHEKLINEHASLQQRGEQQRNALTEACRCINLMRTSNHDLRRFARISNERHQESMAALETERDHGLKLQTTVLDKLSLLEDVSNRIQTQLSNLFPEDGLSTAQSMVINAAKDCLNCGICTEIMETPYVLQCGHIFHRECLLSWDAGRRNEGRRNADCPTCRGVLGALQPIYGLSDLAQALKNLEKSG